MTSYTDFADHPFIDFSCYSDTHKAAYGFRPRGDHHMDWLLSLTREQYAAELDQMGTLIWAQEEEDITRSEGAYATALSEIDAIARDHRVSFDTACRWWLVSELDEIALSGDWISHELDHALWSRGMRYTEAAPFAEMVLGAYRDAS